MNAFKINESGNVNVYSSKILNLRNMTFFISIFHEFLAEGALVESLVVAVG